MATKKCSSSSSYESDSVFPDGYCIWQWDGAQWVLQNCHCKPGCCCEDPNSTSGAGGDYYLEQRKFPCICT